MDCGFKDNDIEESVICNYGEYCTIEKCTFESLSGEDVHNILNNGELTLISPKIKDEGETILNEKCIFIKDMSPDYSSKIYGDGIVEGLDDIIPKTESFDFGYLDKIIHESTTSEITLEENICLERYERDFYEGGIELDIDNLIIDGNGKTIDGANKSRIFIVTGKNVTLKNIIFKNGFSFQNYDNALNNHGGALRINQEANLTIDDCKFMDNGSEEYGSAICNSGELNILTSEISNHASKKKGGAIYNIHGLLNVTNSTLSHNTAARGGAIHNKHGALNMS